VWDSSTGRELRAFGSPLRTEVNFPLAVHPDWRQVITRGAGSVEVWDPQDGKRLRQLPNTLLQVAAYSPDGERLATIAGGRTQIPSAATLEAVRTSEGGGHALAYTRRGDYLALRDDGGVTVWEAATGRQAAQLADATTLVGPLAFSPDGRSLATGNLL